MKKYESLNIEIIILESCDIIMTSTPLFEDASFLRDGSIELAEIEFD